MLGNAAIVLGLFTLMDFLLPHQWWPLRILLGIADATVLVFGMRLILELQAHVGLPSFTYAAGFPDVSSRSDLVMSSLVFFSPFVTFLVSFWARNQIWCKKLWHA
jgi:hypothetical protein